ncbi:MAG: GIY-YIG nuclease family protein, partial [Alphaproteobacteria bacterium]|nr:GIY-YIG nuclease family protein [Alphaproteobacteria bacterium]
MSHRISGLENLKRIVKTLPNQPGVYRLVSKEGIVLYVGKAKNIVKRVTSYTQINRLNTRILHMV